MARAVGLLTVPWHPNGPNSCDWLGFCTALFPYAVSLTHVLDRSILLQSCDDDAKNCQCFVNYIPRALGWWSRGESLGNATLSSSDLQLEDKFTIAFSVWNWFYMIIIQRSLDESDPARMTNEGDGLLLSAV